MSSNGWEEQGGRRITRFVQSFAASALACGMLAVSAQAAVPTIEGVAAKSITSKRATLEATIDPNGLATTYEFWIDYSICQNVLTGEDVCTAMAVEQRGQGHIGAGSSSQSVTTTLTKLEPGYSYTYWVVASNSAGEEHSASQKFKALPAPVVDSESVSAVTSSNSGTLEAQIDPEGQAVYYQFQIVANASEYRSELECPQRLLPDACLHSSSPGGVLPLKYLPAGSAAQSVSLNLAQVGVTLEPNTTYHYRVLVVPLVQTEDTVEWEGPPVDGADQTFKTQAGPPSIEDVSLSHLTSTDATLEAQIDTEGLETTYQFKMWASPCSAHGTGCEVLVDVPLPSGKLLGSYLDQSVSLDLNSAGVTLIPGGEYGYSLTATSTAGSVEGKWQNFTAPENTVVPLKSTSPVDAGDTASWAGSQTPGPSLTQPTIFHALPGLALAGKTTAKGHAEVKRSAKHKKRKRHKSKGPKRKRHETAKR